MVAVCVDNASVCIIVDWIVIRPLTVLYVNSVSVYIHIIFSSQIM